MVIAQSSLCSKKSRTIVEERAVWNAGAMEPNVCQKAQDLNEDNAASMYVHGDVIMLELRTDVFQDVSVMSEYKVDIELSTITRPGQNTQRPRS